MTDTPEPVVAAIDVAPEAVEAVNEDAQPVIAPVTPSQVAVLSGLPTIPTQTQYPVKAVLRTIVAYVLAALTAWALRNVPGVGRILSEYGEALTDYVTVLLIGVIGGIWTWVMSRPKVNAVLTAIGLGARPKAVEKAGDVPPSV